MINQKDKDNPWNFHKKILKIGGAGKWHFYRIHWISSQKTKLLKKWKINRFFTKFCGFFDQSKIIIQAFYDTIWLRLLCIENSAVLVI